MYVSCFEYLRIYFNYVNKASVLEIVFVIGLLTVTVGS